MKSKNTPFTFANSLCFSCKREEKICEGTCGQYAHIGFKDVQRSEATLVKTKQNKTKKRSEATVEQCRQSYTWKIRF
jgi:hypothetical protein